MVSSDTQKPQIATQLCHSALISPPSLLLNLTQKAPGVWGRDEAERKLSRGGGRRVYHAVRREDKAAPCWNNHQSKMLSVCPAALHLLALT